MESRINCIEAAVPHTSLTQSSFSTQGLTEVEVFGSRTLCWVGRGMAGPLQGAITSLPRQCGGNLLNDKKGRQWGWGPPCLSASSRELRAKAAREEALGWVASFPGPGPGHHMLWPVPEGHTGYEALYLGDAGVPPSLAGWPKAAVNIGENRAPGR